MVFIKNALKNTFLFFFTAFISCGSGTKVSSQTSSETVDPIINNEIVIVENQKKDSVAVSAPIIVGANQTELFLPILKDKKVAIVGNQTSVIFKYPNIGSLIQEQNISATNLIQYTHLVDSLVSKNINVQKVFAPEHGFRGKADAGELVADGKDIKTGLPIVSLYVTLTL